MLPAYSVGSVCIWQARERERGITHSETHQQPHRFSVEQVLPGVPQLEHVPFHLALSSHLFAQDR